MSKVVKVMVSIPNEGHAPCEAYTNRLENFFHLGALQERGKLAGDPVRFEFLFLTLGRIFTPIARNEAARFALDQGCDYLYMIDDDMTCPNDLFERLYAHDVDIIAPLAFTRNFPHHPVIYDIKEGTDPVTRSAYFINHHVDSYKKDSLIQCDAVGFGSVLIKIGVLKNMSDPYFMASPNTGEDISFCHYARKCGAKVFVDTSIKLGHLSHPIEVTEAYVEKVRTELKYHEADAMAPQGVVKKMVPGEAVLVLGD